LVQLLAIFPSLDVEKWSDEICPEEVAAKKQQCARHKYDAQIDAVRQEDFSPNKIKTPATKAVAIMKSSSLRISIDATASLNNKYLRPPSVGGLSC
jgi:hypothetical protein